MVRSNIYASSEATYMVRSNIYASSLAWSEAIYASSLAWSEATSLLIKELRQKVVKIEFLELSYGTLQGHLMDSFSFS